MKSIITPISLSAVCFSFFVSALAAEPATSGRQYPGGADEQDLRVQTELADPSLKTDRRTFEQNIMKNIFKKNTASSEPAAKAPAAKAPAAPAASKPAQKPAKKN